VIADAEIDYQSRSPAEGIFREQIKLAKSILAIERGECWNRQGGAVQRNGEERGPVYREIQKIAEQIATVAAGGEETVQPTQQRATARFDEMAVAHPCQVLGDFQTARVIPKGIEGGAAG